jgi:CRP-like cAMP-binding protein
MITWEEYDGIPVRIFQPGFIFGDLETYKNCNRLFSCIAITDLEVLILSKKDFRRVFYRLFPSLGNEYMNEMDRKLEFLKGIMQMIVDCVKFDNQAREMNLPEYQLNPNLLNLKRKSKYIESFVNSIRGKNKSASNS